MATPSTLPWSRNGAMLGRNRTGLGTVIFAEGLFGTTLLPLVGEPSRFRTRACHCGGASLQLTTRGSTGRWPPGVDMLGGFCPLPAHRRSGCFWHSPWWAWQAMVFTHGFWPPARSSPVALLPFAPCYLGEPSFSHPNRIPAASREALPFLLAKHQSPPSIAFTILLCLAQSRPPSRAVPCQRWARRKASPLIFISAKQRKRASQTKGRPRSRAGTAPWLRRPR